VCSELAARPAEEEALALQLSVIPRCPFVASYVRRHPAYLDLLPLDHREQFLAR
jgi:predicted GNAT family acetyltransferase